MKAGGIWLLVVLFSLALAFGGLGFVELGAAGADSTIHTDGFTISDASIAESLDNTTGEVEVALVFEGPPVEELAVSDDPVAFLQAHADDRFAVLRLLADTTASIDIESTSWLATTATVSVDTDEYTIEQLSAIPHVIAIEPGDETVKQLGSPVGGNEDGEVPQQSYTYGLEQINAPDVWDTFDTRGAGVAVSVLDTGVDPDHPDIDVVKWRDFNPDDPSDDPKDYGAHGTHVAGTVVGGDAGGTHIGVAPDAKLYAGAVLTDCDGGCSGRTQEVIAGMEWSVDEGADVISMSLGSISYTWQYIQAVEHAIAADVAVVAAIGNDGEGTSASPANVYDVISVGASDESESITDFSSGEEIDTDDAWGFFAPNDWPDSYIVPVIAAPGHQVLSANAGGGYRFSSGTSMATPHVAGAIALMQSATDRHLSHEALRDTLIETANHPDNAEQDTRYGHGILDVFAATESILETGIIEGTVTDTITDEPINGVTLTTANGVTVEATTGSDGTFVLDAIEPGTYEVTAERDGYETATETDIEVVEGETTIVDFSLVGDAALALDIEDAIFETSIEDASITVEGPFGTYPVEEASGGQYTVDDVPSVGTYQVNVDATGYESTTHSVTVTDAGSTVSQTIGLDGDGAVELTVTDAITGASLEGVDLSLERADGETSTVPAATEGDGAVTLKLTSIASPYQLELTRDGYHTAAVTDIEVTSDETISLAPSLEGDGAIEVTVTDSLFETPLESAEVVAAGPFGTYPSTETEPGTYHLTGVPSIGDHQLQLEATGYESLVSSIAVTEPGSTVTEDVSLSGDAAIELEVHDGVTDHPLDGATLTITRETGASVTVDGATDADGHLIQQVPGTGETYTVTVDRAGYDATETSASIDPGAPESLSLELFGDSTLELTLLDATFEDGIEDATVDIEGPHGAYAVTTAVDGEYRIEDLPSIGTYNIEAAAAGYHAVSAMTTMTDTGETRPMTIDMTGDATLTITVVDGGETPIEGAVIDLEAGEDRQVSLEEWTDEAGIVTVAVPGTNQNYTVRASADGYLQSSLDTDPIDSGDEVTVTLTLATLSRIPGFTVAIAFIAMLAAATLLQLRRRL